jgi:CheY-like chemotaxis protein
MMDVVPPPPGDPQDDPLTILVMNDDELVRRFVRRTLEPAGCDLVEPPHGVAGLRIVEEDSPPIDAVITDLRMAFINGYEVVQVLSQHRPDLAVVVISEYPCEDPRLGGARAFLYKPFEPEELLETLAPILQRVRAMRVRARQQRADAGESRTIAALQRAQARSMRERRAGLVAAALALQTHLQAP